MRVGYPSTIFFVALCKTFMGKGLRANGLENPAQNLVLQGVTAKILWNKDLARLAEVLLGLLVENGRGRLWRTSPACALQNSQ